MTAFGLSSSREKFTFQLTTKSKVASVDKCDTTQKVVDKVKVMFVVWEKVVTVLFNEIFHIVLLLSQTYVFPSSSLDRREKAKLRSCF